MRTPYLATVNLASAVCLVVVFVVAAVGKLASPGGARRATSVLGGPSWFAPLVVPAELGIAALLLIRPALGSLAAGIMLAVFTVALARVVRSGRTVSCGCFGSADSAPVSGRTITRNVALLAVCVPAAFAPSLRSTTGDTLIGALVVAAGGLAIALMVTALADIRRVTGSLLSVAADRAEG
jgi:hypothetical protein